MHLLFYQINEKPSRQPLTMAQQCSEMKDQFTDKMIKQQSTAVKGSDVTQPTGVNTLLADHHQHGPTKVLLILST